MTGPSGHRPRTEHPTGNRPYTGNPHHNAPGVTAQGTADRPTTGSAGRGGLLTVVRGARASAGPLDGQPDERGAGGPPPGPYA